MRKAFRTCDGRILVPRGMNDEEWDYALSLHTPRELQQLGKDFDRMLRSMLWRLKHPRLASLLDAVYMAGLGMMRSPFF